MQHQLVVDPSLVVYSDAEVLAGGGALDLRIESLLVHRDMRRKFGIGVVASREFLREVLMRFSWSLPTDRAPLLRDVRTFVLSELQRATLLPSDDLGPPVCSNLPRGYLLPKEDTLRDAFLRLAFAMGMSAQSIGVGCAIGSQVGDGPGFDARSCLRVRCPDTSPGEHPVPLVADKSSWYRFLRGFSWWPDIPRCVEVYANSEPGFLVARRSLREPRAFVLSRRFCNAAAARVKSADLQNGVIEALAKRIYGIVDAGLRDEPFEGGRRMRLSGGWRIHYHVEGARLLFDDVGPHSLGLHR